MPTRGIGLKLGYTIKQKIDICLMAESNPQLTQAELANWAKKKYHTSKPPSQTTISRILAKKDEFISLKEHDFRLIRRRKPSNVLLREILSEWICQSVWEGIPISVPIIQSSAASMWKILPQNLREGSGEFSHKWCSHVLTKMDVTMSKIATELLRPGKVWNLNEERNHLKQYFSQFNLGDIFVVDEMFLYYKLPLDQTHLAADQLETLNGITVMLTTNAAGTEKLEPLVVGHYESMRCFGGKPASKIGAKYEMSYKSNKRARLTAIVFSGWLVALDKRLSLSKRRIVLVLDDSASHRVVNVKLDYITLVFFQHQSQDVLPLANGVFREFKVLYRLQQYLLMINLQRKQGSLTVENHGIAVTDALLMIKNAWNNVTVGVIKNAWIRADMIDIDNYAEDQFPGLEETVKDGKDSEWGNNSNNHYTASLTANTALDFKNSEFKLLQMIKQLDALRPWDLDSLVRLNIENKFTVYKSPAEMVECCIVEEFEPATGQDTPAQIVELPAESPETKIEEPAEPSLFKDSVFDNAPFNVDEYANLMPNQEDFKLDFTDDLQMNYLFKQEESPPMMFNLEPPAELESPDQFQYNQHVNRYTANSLFSPPVKKGNLSSVITIPDNSHSFGEMYHKKRKMSEPDSVLLSENTTASYTAETTSERVAKSIAAVLSSAMNNEIELSQNCIRELKNQLTLVQADSRNEIGTLAETLANDLELDRVNSGW